ncbi:MAG: proton-conducting transporter membrane subunit [Fimbriimonadales bacterium]
MTADPILLCGISIIVWLVAGAIGCIWRRPNAPILPILVVSGCTFLLVGALAGRDGVWSLSLPIYLADAKFGFMSDPLSRWFLTIIAVIGIPVCLFAPGYLEHHRRRISLGFVWAGIALLLASMVGVVFAANAIAFLVAWEVMAFSSFALVAADHEQRSIRHAAMVYLGATRVGTAFLMGGFLWVYTLTGTWTFANWHLAGTAALGPALMILVGLATKAGCWPFHLWLPIAHPAAPAPVSALMSGVMIKTAIYAMVRLFVLGHHLNAPCLGTIILVLGAISGFWGVIFALLQHDLKRLLAYHSVENIGIILMGIGVALVCMDNHRPALAEIGLAAALFHTLNHAVFKSLLFLGTGAIDARTRIRNVEELGGLIHRMPWTGAMFIVGSAAICALPPLNGFASEWLLYKSFFGIAMTGATSGERLSGLLLMGWLGLIGALAVACFVKAVGVVFLGVPRSSRARNAKEASRPMVLSQIGLAAACVLLGLAAPGVLSLLGPTVAQLGSEVPIASAWTLPNVWLGLVLVAAVGAIGYWANSRARAHPTRRFITWECGFGPLGPRTQYTAASFAQPISRIFGAIYRYAIEVTVRNRQREHFPMEVEVEMLHEAYLETRLYKPLLRGIRRTAGGFLMRLQAGSIHQYLIYMVVVLAVLLAIGVAK